MASITGENTKKYLEWLSTEINFVKFNQYCSAYKEIEEYCINKKKKNKPLLEIDSIDTLQEVKNIVEKDSIFGFSHKENKTVLIKAILMFYRYVKENYEVKSNVIEKEKDFNFEGIDKDNLVVEYMKYIKKDQTIDQLKEKLNLNEEKIKEDLKKEECIILLDEKIGKYIYAPAFPILPEEIEEITIFLDKYLKNNLFMIDFKLTEYINKNMSRLADIIKEYTRYGWRDCLGYLIKDKFSIKNAIISKIGDDISILDCYAYICEKRKIFDVKELKKLSSVFHLNIPFPTILNKSLRINVSTFIRWDILDIDVTGVDNLLEKICLNDYFPIKDVENYDEFPDIGIEWNGFVLESFLQACSKAFKLINSGFSIETYLGAMVKRNSDISTYGNLIYHVLKDNKDKWNDKKSAMKYIVEHKYRLDTNFSNLEEIITKIEADILEEAKLKQNKKLVLEKPVVELDYGKIPEELENRDNPKIKYIYFDEVHTGFPNISMMYVDFINTLLEDYDFVINELKDKSIINLIYSTDKEQLMKPKKLSNGIYIDDYIWIMSKRDIVDRSQISELSIPGMLSNGLCIESDLDLNQILKRIKVFIDVCKIERKNIQIYIDKKEILNSETKVDVLASNSTSNTIIAEGKVSTVSAEKTEKENNKEEILNSEIKVSAKVDDLTINNLSISTKPVEEIKNSNEKIQTKEEIKIVIEAEIKERFYQWLKVHQGMGRGEFEKKINENIKQIDDFAHENALYKDSLYFYTNPGEIKEIKKKLNDIIRSYEEKIKELTLKQSLEVMNIRRLLSDDQNKILPLDQYLIFLNDSETLKKDKDSNILAKEESSDISKEKIVIYSELDVEEAFYQWLKTNKGMTRSLFERYVNHYIEKLNDFGKKQNIYTDNLYSHTDYKEVKKIRDQLIDHYKFYEENNQILPLNRYIRFLEQVEKKSIIIKSKEKKLSDNNINKENNAPVLAKDSINTVSYDMEKDNKKDNKEIENKVIKFLKELDEKSKLNKKRQEKIDIVKSELDVEESFYQWLKDTREMSRSNFERFMNYYIKKIDNFARLNNIYTGSLYSHTNCDEVKKIKKLLLKNRRFKEENIQSLPLSRYIIFLEERGESLRTTCDKVEIKEKYQTKKEHSLDETIKEVKEKFYNWLKDEQKLSKKSSNIYTTYGINVIDKISQKNNIYDQTLYCYNNVEKVEEIKEKLNKNRNFINENNRLHHTLTATLNKYILFISNMYTDKSIDTEKINMINCSEEKINFSLEDDYTYTKPIRYSLYGKEYVDFKSWATLYINFINVLMGIDKKIIEKLKNDKIIKSTNRLDIVDFWNKKVLRRPRQLSNGFYVEINLSTKDIIKRMKALLSLYRINLEEMNIYYKKESEDENMKINTSSTSVKSAIENSKHTEIPKSIEIKNNVKENNGFYKILSKNFKRGFRKNSFIDEKKFKRYWQEEYGTKLELEKDELYSKLSEIASCYTTNDTSILFIVENMLEKQAKDQLFVKLDQEFLKGKKAIYYNVIYKVNMELFHGSTINNEDMLKFYLSNIDGMKYYPDKLYLAREKGVKLDSSEEIRDYLLNKGIPQSMDEICKKLSHIPSNKIMKILNTNKQFINNGSKQYFCVDIVELSEEEHEIIKNIIEREIRENKYMSEKTLMSLLEINIPSILEKYEYISTSGLRSVIAYKFDRFFSFFGKIISAKNSNLSMGDIYYFYSEKKEQITMDELNDLKDELDSGTIFLNAVYKNAIRISKDKFISKRNIQFDVKEIDNILDKFCTGDYILINEIKYFGSFPDIGYRWNEFLLEHYVAEYSQKYKLIHTDFNENYCRGAIVKIDSNINDFYGLVLNIIVNSEIEVSGKKEVLNYLYDLNLIARRSYKYIAEVLTEAKSIRERKI